MRAGLYLVTSVRRKSSISRYAHEMSMRVTRSQNTCLQLSLAPLTKCVSTDTFVKTEKIIFDHAVGRLPTQCRGVTQANGTDEPLLTARLQYLRWWISLGRAGHLHFGCRKVMEITAAPQAVGYDSGRISGCHGWQQQGADFRVW